MKPAHPLISIPTFDGTIHYSLVNSIMRARETGPKSYQFASSSVLPFCFNTLWANALNMRPGITHFAMLHADIQPEPLWLDKMLEIMDRVGADILSAVVPFKSPTGITSTAIEAEPWHPKRLTMKEIFKYPTTFTDDKILVNSGLMLVDLRNPWVDKICFRFADDLETGPDGKLQAVSVSEDWNFSIDARLYGAKVYATREVTLSHIAGVTHFRNDSAWGME